MKKISFFLVISLAIFSCKTTKNAGKLPTGFQKIKNNETEIVFLQLNDVYEISPLEDGKVGGLARVATVRKELLAHSPNTYTVMCGDFLNPSLLSTLKYEGKSIKGRQMVEVMNAMPVDWIGFGNHEFDLDEKDLQARLNESTSKWISTNAFHKTKDGVEPFAKIEKDVKTNFPKNSILTVKDANGKDVKIGIFSVVLPANKKDYVWYDDFFETSKKSYEELKSQCDFVVAITHLFKDDDLKLATLLPDVPLIMGGHDHNNMIFHVGKTTMTKADANAKTVYIHQLLFNRKTKKIRLTSILKPINDQIKDDENTKKIVDKWDEIMDASIKKLGLDRKEIIKNLLEPLDGREATNRNQQTNLGTAVAKAMTESTKTNVDGSIFNSGAIRIDDQISGKVTQVDILRALPYGGKLMEVQLKGSLLQQVLETGLKNKGNGGYLQLDNFSFDAVKNQWFVGGKILELDKIYTVMFTDYLMQGKETNLDFLNPQNSNIIKITEPLESDKTDLRNDIRKALIAYLKAHK